MVPFGSKSVTLSRWCRLTQVKIYTGLIASTDLWPQEILTFLEMLALVVSESSFGASGGLWGSTTTSGSCSNFWNNLENFTKLDMSWCLPWTRQKLHVKWHGWHRTPFLRRGTRHQRRPDCSHNRGLKKRNERKRTIIVMLCMHWSIVLSLGLITRYCNVGTQPCMGCEATAIHSESHSTNHAAPCFCHLTVQRETNCIFCHTPWWGIAYGSTNEQIKTFSPSLHN